MAITDASVADEIRNTTDGSIDYRGNSAVRFSSGGWKSARLIISSEMAERFAYYGISSNLIMYLTGPLGESTATAAANVNAWIGTVSFLPLLWGFIADSFLGRFRTIIISSCLYILGLGLLTFSAMIPLHCEDQSQRVSCASQLQVTVFFCSLYLVAIGQGGYLPCMKVFGADQFDRNDQKEAKAKSSFFNWLMFGNCISILMSRVVSNYIQENVSWFLGFGIPSVSMLLALFLFLLGITSYRFSIKSEGNENPFARISRVFMAALKNRRQRDLVIANTNETLLLTHQSSKQFRFLDRAAISCELGEIEEAKAVLRLVPIWMTCLVYAIVTAQSTTLFTKQGATMDRSISPGLLVPSATLQSFISLSMVVSIPIYDRLLVPIARSFTHKPSGITILQRIGTGIFLSILTMVVAALVETKRLQTARDDVTILMSVWWLVPQYVLCGVSNVFTMVGLQEFFYDQVPSELRSIGMALNLSIYGVGSFLSSFIISVIDKVTSQSGQRSWFDNDLNHAHLDYYYWLLGCLSFIGLASYLWFAKSYVYSRPNTF
ncbi:Protein NRT1/ PTR FAMILY 5.11 [Cardamine amara subsp. amara]|uniref:Protein NRT1/ PTR FAMILY 5.11 n=1 Tax=Cardamine amara subsp. amara TaxID=228776 RepID=A0ABD1BRR3_CARAN